MLRHVIAPSRDFTPLSNAQIWDDDLSDSAFRLLARSLAMPEAKAGRTTVTELASGLTGGRLTADKARRQLTQSRLLHCKRGRDAKGQLRTESLMSSVPLTEAEAEEIFAPHFADPPGAGNGRSGGAAVPRSGTDLPTGETLLGDETSPLPVPQEEPEEAPEPVAPDEAERVLLSLRRTDHRLTLGAAEVRRLAPLAAEWLARGASPAGLVHALTTGLPSSVKSPAALMKFRLESKMPPVPFTATELVSCHGCERPLRPVGGERRCGRCRQGDAVPSKAGPTLGWRERFALVLPVQ